MVPGREKHQSLLIRTQCNTNHRQPDKASSCQQRSISTVSPVTCIHRIHSCHWKYSLAQFTFLTQRHHPHSKLDFQGSILPHQPSKDIFRSWKMHNYYEHCLSRSTDCFPAKHFQSTSQRENVFGRTCFWDSAWCSAELISRPRYASEQNLDSLIRQQATVCFQVRHVTRVACRLRSHGAASVCWGPYLGVELLSGGDGTLRKLPALLFSPVFKAGREDANWEYSKI